MFRQNSRKVESRHKPSNRLNPIFELIMALGRYLESCSCRENCVGELLVVGRREMIQLRVNALDVPEGFNLVSDSVSIQQ